MWVPAHVGIDGNEMVDRIAKESAASGNLYRGGALECDDLCPQMKSCLLMDWQSRWDGQVCLFNISPTSALSLVFGRGGGPSGDYGDFPLDF
jgi:hypothetical protein